MSPVHFFNRWMRCRIDASRRWKTDLQDPESVNAVIPRNLCAGNWQTILLVPPASIKATSHLSGRRGHPAFSGNGRLVRLEMAFIFGVRVVSYGLVGAAAILTHETTKAYKQRLYNWALEKLIKSRSSPPQSQGPTPPCQYDAENKASHQTTDQHLLNDDAHLAVPQIQELTAATGEVEHLLNDDAHLAVQQIQQLTAATGENEHLLNDDAHLVVPQIQQLTAATGENDDDAHLAVRQIQQLTTATGENDDDARLSVRLQQQQLNATDKDNDANLPVLQQQQEHHHHQQQQQLLTAPGKHADVHLPVRQPPQEQLLAPIGKEDDVYQLNDDHSVKISHFIDKEQELELEPELKASSETSEDHGTVKIVGEAKHEQSQAPPRSPPPPGRGAFSFSKAFNAAKSKAYGLFCWARGMFEGKRGATVRLMIARIGSRVFWLITDAVFHEKFKLRNKVLQQIMRIIINELKAALLIV